MSEWQPIETAPRIRRVLVGTKGSSIVDIAIQVETLGKWMWVTDDRESQETGYFKAGEPTHWQPIPAGPK